MTLGSLMHVARYRATPLPVIVIGDADPDAEVDAQRGASYLVRPSNAQACCSLSAWRWRKGGLCDAPAQARAAFAWAHRRRPVARIDVSQEGAWLEVAERHRTSLPPAFTLRVPVFNVAVLVQCLGEHRGRPSSQLWCGGALTRNPQRSAQSWQMLVDMTPGSAA
jgi:hypothetical protein